jgi:hypothetical protein
LSRIPTKAFGYSFTHIPKHVRDDLDSLEREGVLYTDRWIDELDDFRHVRITLTPEERVEYARRSWAFELWLRAGQPEWARDAPGIDQDVAHDADTYILQTATGETFGPLYHCFAAFLGAHLEEVACTNRPERTTVIELQGKESVLVALDRAIQALTPTIRSFNAREKGLDRWDIKREDDVRDLLYVMLKPVLFDLVKEEPTPTLAGTHKFVDLCSKTARIFIELKWISRANQWKAIVDQIHVDIQAYSVHEFCETQVFVIVDSARDIPDPRLLERELTGKQIIRGRTVDIRVYVVEP